MRYLIITAIIVATLQHIIGNTAHTLSNRGHQIDAAVAAATH